MPTFVNLGWFKALCAAACFASGWAVNGWRLDSTIAKMETKQAKGVALRAEAARVDSEATAKLEAKHAEGTIYNADKLASIKTNIGDNLRADLVSIERLHIDSKRRAATYRAQADADATARRDLADKAAALDSDLSEGRQLVRTLRANIEQRDAEVSALCDQVNIERRLLGDDSNSACSG